MGVVGKCQYRRHVFALQLLTTRSSCFPLQSKQAYEVVRIAKQFHPFIQGPGGETMRRIIGDRPNVRINIPPLSVIKDEISVAGEKEGVMACIEQINKMQKDMVS